MFGMGGGQPMPKGDIRKLWEVLGIQSSGQVGQEGLFAPDLVWQSFNPYPKLQVSGIPDEWVFVREEESEGASGLINAENEITSDLDEIFLPFPGQIEPAPSSELKFVKLLNTRELSGTIGFEQMMQNQGDPAMLQALQKPRPGMTLAALIETEGDDVGQDASAAGKQKEAKKDEPKGDSEKKSDPAEAKKEDPATAAPARIRAVYVADIDLMIPAFLRIRARPDEQEDMRWEFENVTFLLNTIDVLANETDYVKIRKRKPRYTTLKVVEERVEEARDHEFTKRVEFRDAYDKAVKEAEAKNEETLEKFRTIVTDLQKQQSEGKEINQAELREKVQRLEEQQRVAERRLGITKQRLERERERDIQRIQREVDLEIQRMQFTYKAWAVAVPWIPPFLVGIVVFVRRRLREREGIEKSRLR